MSDTQKYNKQFLNTLRTMPMASVYATQRNLRDRGLRNDLLFVNQVIKERKSNQA